jgi:hypothetical protein
MPMISTIFFNYIISFGLKLLKIFDQGWVELLFPKQLYGSLVFSGRLVDASLTINLKLFLR